MDGDRLPELARFLAFGFPSSASVFGLLERDAFGYAVARRRAEIEMTRERPSAWKNARSTVKPSVVLLWSTVIFVTRPS